MTVVGQKKGLVIGFLLLGWLLAIPVSIAQAVGGDEERERHRVKLNRVINRLVRERQALRKTRDEAKTLLEEVENLDRRLNEGGQRMEVLARRIEETKIRLTELAELIRTGRIDLKRRRGRLAAHIRLMYGLGGRGMLKVIFSQESTAQVRQGILYYGRLIHTRNEQFKNFKKTLHDLHLSLQEHERLLKRLQELSVALAEEQQQRQLRREERTVLLDRVSRERDLHQRKLVELKRAREELTTFVERLTDTLDREVPPPKRAFTAVVRSRESPPSGSPRPREPSKTDDGRRSVERTDRSGRVARETPPRPVAGGREVPQPISERKGRLPRPVKGRVRNKPPGLFYNSAENTPVHAIHHGQVVYADWFRGYGLLIILNHGEHVYSLYGHNQRLMVSQGDWVKAGDRIAKSGDTGSLEGIPGLYFELRQKGKAVNARRWLMASGRKKRHRGRKKSR